ncbi:hypothetical protein PENANT_c019G10510 [Penicillium antarcticum]|uniref:Uncharacterized protein n=1 Tax=Penicillium antarcticum TaxID=416450 RepID=A0A1V6Q0Q6_9EURO|nr:hypothetical protein PENANT_c019G10510 [Penicillium antarcticum]
MAVATPLQRSSGISCLFLQRSAGDTSSSVVGSGAIEQVPYNDSDRQFNARLLTDKYRESKYQKQRIYRLYMYWPILLCQTKR